FGRYGDLASSQGSRQADARRCQTPWGGEDPGIPPSAVDSSSRAIACKGPVSITMEGLGVLTGPPLNGCARSLLEPPRGATGRCRGRQAPDGEPADSRSAARLPRLPRPRSTPGAGAAEGIERGTSVRG